MKELTIVKNLSSGVDVIAVETDRGMKLFKMIQRMNVDVGIRSGNYYYFKGTNEIYKAEKDKENDDMWELEGINVLGNVNVHRETLDEALNERSLVSLILVGEEDR